MMTSDYKATNQKEPKYVDPLTRKYESYKPSGIGKPHKYTEYKPTHVGIYGEKQRAKRINTPPKTTPRKYVKRQREPVVRYKYYGNPTGPDIKLGAMGPDYKIPPYKPTPYKAPKPLVFNNAFNEDPLRHRAAYMAKYKPSEASKPTAYKLTKDNYAPMKFWRFGDVNDTVSSGPRYQPKKKYTVQEKPTKKTFTSSSTQSVVIATKNAPTQTAVTNKTAMTQTTSLPSVNVVPVPGVVKENKHKQKTTGTQYSPPPITPVSERSLTLQDSRYTTPVAQRTPTPLHTTPEQIHQQTPTPSPLVPVFVPLVASQSPIKQPKATIEEEPALAYTAPATKQSRLPPEISAHIEAYNSVHVPGEATPSIQRTMRFI